MNRMHAAIVAMFLLPAALLSAGCGQSEASVADRSFVTQVGQQGLAEVDRARIAQARGGSDAVRQYGARIAEDYRAANARLGELARAGGVAVPQGISEGQRDLRRELAGLSGSAFDRRYMESEVRAHRRAIEQCKSSEAAARLTGLREFARARLPQLRQHLDRAEGVATRLRMAPAD